jgi:hypothetical protein
MITSKFLSIHTDIDKNSDLPSWLKPNHPNWIGAWWLPFLTFGFGALIFALVIFIFPRRIVHKQPPSEKQPPPAENGNGNGNGTTVKEVELKSLNSNGKENGHLLEPTTAKIGNGDEACLQTRDYESNPFVEATKEMGSLLSLNIVANGNHHHPTSAGAANGTDLNEKLTLIDKSMLLFKRPVYLFVLIASALEGLLQNSFLAFATLFLEYQYRLASGSASLILGLLSIPPLMIGGILSGIIVKRLKNRTSSCFKLLAVVIFINIIVYSGFMVFCREANMIWPGSDHAVFTTSKECSCNSKIFKPVCLKDSQDIFFQSACLAGCSSFETDMYFNCTQVEPQSYFTNGLCPHNSCTLRLIVSFTCIALLMFLNALTFLPYLKVTIGCINSREMNSIGLGFKQFFMNAFGTIPGPILFGSVIDTTCKYWHNDMNDRRVCKIYNNQQFAFAFGLLGIGFKSIIFILIILSLVVLKRSKNIKK